MSLFYYFTFFLGIILFPINSSAQSYLQSPGRKCPPGYLSNERDSSHFLSISYTSPYGLSSLTSLDLRYQRPLKRGRLISEVNTFGIPGYYQFKLGVGFRMQAGTHFSTGLFLNALIFQFNDPGIRKLFPGSSFFLSYKQPGRFFTFLRIDDWPGFLLSETHYPWDPNIRIHTEYISYSGISLMGGFSYEAGLSPLFTGGLMINTNKGFRLGAGMQSGPAGFWIASAFTRNKLDFIFSLNTSGIFGYEPSALFKYHFK